MNRFDRVASKWMKIRPPELNAELMLCAHCRHRTPEGVCTAANERVECPAGGVCEQTSLRLNGLRIVFLWASKTRKAWRMPTVSAEFLGARESFRFLLIDNKLPVPFFWRG